MTPESLAPNHASELLKINERKGFLREENIFSNDTFSAKNFIQMKQDCATITIWCTAPTEAASERRVGARNGAPY
jgi:hypothetical protein